jgi:hypothetical protein
MIFNEQDVNMKMMLGEPIELSTIGVLKPKTINSLLEIGFDIYNQYLSMLCLTSDDIYEILDMNDDFQDINPFDFILSNCVNNEDFKIKMEQALSFFLEEDVHFFKIMEDEYCKGGYFYVHDINEGRFIHIANFSFFIDLLKEQNCIPQKPTNKRRKPKNEAEKDMYRQLNKARAKYNKQDTDMSDIVSSVSAKHPSINLFNVGSLSIYQLIDQYKRLNAIDEYFINIESLLHGASSEEVKLSHWSSKQK